MQDVIDIHGVFIAKFSSKFWSHFSRAKCANQEKGEAEKGDVIAVLKIA